MGDLGGGEGGVAGFDATDEVALVAGAAQAEFACLDLAVAEFGGGGVEAAAVDVDPFAVFAVPGGAAVDLRAVGDGEFDAVGVAAGVAVGLGGVVDAVGLEGGVAFKGDGAGGVAVEAPLGDVGVVADPVHHLAAAPVEDPAPVPVVDALEGAVGGGAEPEVPVEFGRDLGVGVGGFAAPAGGEADVDADDFADAPVADEFDGAAHFAGGALPAPGLPDAAVLADGVDEGAAFEEVVGEGFLAVDVFAVAGGESADGGVPVVGGGDHDGVDVGAGADVAEVFEHEAVGVGVAFVDAFLGGFHLFGVDVADGADGDVVYVEEGSHVAVAHAADADHGHGDAVAGGVLAEDAGGDDVEGGRGGGGGGVAEEGAA